MCYTAIVHTNALYKGPQDCSLKTLAASLSQHFVGLSFQLRNNKYQAYYDIEEGRVQLTTYILLKIHHTGDNYYENHANICLLCRSSSKPDEDGIEVLLLHQQEGQRI